LAALTAAAPDAADAVTAVGADSAVDGGCQCSWLHVSLAQGKTNEVRRACAHLNLRVLRLVRLGFGSFALGRLAVGELEEVDDRHVETLREAVMRSVVAAGG